MLLAKRRRKDDDECPSSVRRRREPDRSPTGARRFRALPDEINELDPLVPEDRRVFPYSDGPHENLRLAHNLASDPRPVEEMYELFRRPIRCGKTTGRTSAAANSRWYRSLARRYRRQT